MCIQKMSMKQPTKHTARHVQSGKLALYFGSTAFYLTFFYIWKCSFWLLCRPWYLFIYFGLDYRPLLRRTSLLQWWKSPRHKLFWCRSRTTTLWKVTKVIIRTPYTVVVITMWLTFVGPLRLPGALRRHLGRLKTKGARLALHCICSSSTEGATVEEQLLLSHPDDFQILAQHNGKLMFYKNLPLRQISHLWGQFVNLPHFPVWFRVAALKYYIWLYGCKFHEAANQDLKSYSTLGDFFRRQLKKEVRPIHGGDCVVSPADGRIMQCGTVKNGLLEQIKGVTFPLKCFLGPVCDDQAAATLCFYSVMKKSHRQQISTKKKSQRQQISTDILPHSSCIQDKLDLADIDDEEELERLPSNNKHYQSVLSEMILSNGTHHSLYYSVVYLSPGDYHRFHSPVDWTVTGRRHFSGNLHSVKPAIACWLQGLFCVNERVMYVGRWKFGFFSMTAVGALNVGSINVFFDKTLETNSRRTTQLGQFEDVNFVTKKHKGISLTKGQLMGDFNLGSTIVILFEAPCGFNLNIVPNRTVKYGQCIGK